MACIKRKQATKAKICGKCIKEEEALVRNMELIEYQQESVAKAMNEQDREISSIRSKMQDKQTKIEASVTAMTEKTSEQERAISSIRNNEIPAIQQSIQKMSEEQAKEKRKMQEEMCKMKFRLSCLEKQVQKSNNEKEKSKNDMESMKIKLQLEQLKLDSEQERKQYFDEFLQKNISPEVAVQAVQSIGGNGVSNKEELFTTTGVEELNREEEDRVDCPLLTEELQTRWK